VAAHVHTDGKVLFATKQCPVRLGLMADIARMKEIQLELMGTADAAVSNTSLVSTARLMIGNAPQDIVIMNAKTEVIPLVQKTIASASVRWAGKMIIAKPLNGARSSIMV